MCGRGWQQYVKWREPASADANRKAKALATPTAPHPFLGGAPDEAAALVDMIKNYTPKGVSIFYFSVTLYRHAYGRVGRVNLEIRQSVSYASSNFRDVTCCLT